MREGSKKEEEGGVQLTADDVYILSKITVEVSARQANLRHQQEIMMSQLWR